jgi:hypothetical protein
MDSRFRALLSGEIFRRSCGEAKTTSFQRLENLQKALDSSFRWNDEVMALNFQGNFLMPGAMPAHF